MITYGIENFPCKIITNENFRSLHANDPDFTLGSLIFNPVAKATSEQQLVDYFSSELGYQQSSANIPDTLTTRSHLNTDDYLS